VAEHDETLISETVCYNLYERLGHVIGTVIHCQMQRSQKGTSYHFIWEYTALGESTLTLSEVSEGYKEGEKVMLSRYSTSTTASVKRVRRQRGISKDDLCCMSEDELESMPLPVMSHAVLELNVLIMSAIQLGGFWKT
jgi:hypothetical protein